VIKEKNMTDSNNVIRFPISKNAEPATFEQVGLIAAMVVKKCSLALKAGAFDKVLLDSLEKAKIENNPYHRASRGI
jgi:hypothetical protein